MFLACLFVRASLCDGVSKVYHKLVRRISPTTRPRPIRESLSQPSGSQTESHYRD